MACAQRRGQGGECLDEAWQVLAFVGTACVEDEGVGQAELVT